MCCPRLALQFGAAPTAKLVGNDNVTASHSTGDTFLLIETELEPGAPSHVNRFIRVYLAMKFRFPPSQIIVSSAYYKQGQIRLQPARLNLAIRPPGVADHASPPRPRHPHARE